MAHNCSVIKEDTLISGRSHLTTFRITCDKCGLIEKAQNERDAKYRADQHELMPHRR